MNYKIPFYSLLTLGVLGGIVFGPRIIKGLKLNLVNAKLGYYEEAIEAGSESTVEKKYRKKYARKKEQL
ncbi:hypothetical protein [Muricomes intestini]|uniref:Uncharacterized protein n=1 Tax=Muricomes intestini TaxID=1796634 RepID=A0A4R3K481_9FIRM|nr:hypothetical protein [Muricomes intestini]TCS77533.1 hypothetical protein EDD59_11614 [Muricomes intestini]HAX50388.1 hypothetical protein [Lachnospiraceae bacterium]HCR84721.1 hypothetical protein [Lachnospiraceae bacterium]